MKQADYKFYALTPTDDADLGIYESALDFVFAGNDVKNVAVSGAYGAGKSSVLASYKKKHSDKRFLHISLAHFRPENKGAVGESETNPTVSTETILEGKILNQLIHQISPERIPRTNFRVKKETSKKRNILTAILATIDFFLGVYAFFFPHWLSFVQELTAEWLRNALAFSEYAESRLVAGTAFIVISGIFAYRLVKLQESRHIIKKADISGFEIEIFEDSNESFFDKYLNEVLYLFENADADVIVFEDIDRYDSSGIFERLHEINTLVNNDRKSNLLRFFYLMRDDIFVSKDRTKFFDFIIPIVPVVDGSNAFNKFLECFQTSGIVGKDEKGGVGINLEFLQGLSLYIDDMRILQNICNEFSVYHSRLSTTEQDPNKMLALISYKNLFPRDFAELQLGQGFMCEIISGNGKGRLIASEEARLESIIGHKSVELSTVRAEFLTEDELSIIYAKKVFTSNWYHWDATTCKQQLFSQRQNRQHKDIVDEYELRLTHAANSAESKDNRIARVEKELSTLNDELVTLLGKRLCELITRENIDTFFNGTVFKSETGVVEPFTTIKDSPYFPMLKYLVREGFIDETYSDYMTYFYENSLSRTDKVFLRSVTDKKAKEPSYKLDDADMVASRLPLAYFEQEETLNYALLEFLLSDYVNSRRYADKTKKLLEQISENNLYGVLIEYASFSDKTDDLVKAIGTEWDSFLSDFFAYYKMIIKPSEPVTINDIFVRRIALTLFRLVGESEDRLSFVDKDSADKLVEYVSNDSDFLNTDIFEIREMAIGIKRFEVKFVALKVATANHDLLKSIYEDSSYVINYENILTMLREYYSTTELSNIATNGYTIIMSDKESPLAKYINTNIDVYTDVMLENCNENITDSQECAISIINNAGIEKEKRNTYISYLNTTISELLDIKDTDFWSGLLSNGNALEYSATNIVVYFSGRCKQGFDDALIKFINSKGTIITFKDVFKNDDEKKAFFGAVVKAVSLTNVVYKGYVEQFALYYKNFEIEDLPIDKLSILDELGKIVMTAESLQFIREHYSDYLYTFITNHITGYVDVISETSFFVFAEVLVLLDKKIDDAQKVKLLQYTQERISVQGKKYSDDVSAYILKNNYDESDFEYLVSKYETFGKQARAAILELSVHHIDRLQTVLDTVSNLLISDVLTLERVALKTKQDIFKVLAPNASDNEIKQWLGKVGLDDFLRLYEERTRPKFENTEINVAVLEIFKNRHLIVDYELDKNSSKYQISRRKTFALSEPD